MAYYNCKTHGVNVGHLTFFIPKVYTLIAGVNYLVSSYCNLNFTYFISCSQYKINICFAIGDGQQSFPVISRKKTSIISAHVYIF